ncbi:MAG: hypothetical protein NWE98_02185 [Candidatus Bathyarchaeota archaeon]|nr:hypothetical protein [Candidatus Bathyarchaeota archaeon]
MKQLRKALAMSLHFKQKNNWSRETGAGFIAEDIENIQYNPANKTLTLKFGWGTTQTVTIRDLNLRETEEAIKWIDKKWAEWNENFYKKLKESI